MKNTSKKIGFMAVAIVLSMSLFFSSCKKEVGPTGPAGANGKDGNANVLLYNFPSHDYSTTSLSSNVITMPQDSFDSYVWLAYLKYDNTLTYAIPGYGVNGTTNYRFYTYNASATTHEMTISKVSGAGESYQQVKFVGIQIGTVIGKKSSLPAIDFNDYNAVKKYYNLKD